MGEAGTDSVPKQSRHRIEILVLQPTPFCNLDCSYCYLPNRTDRRRMSLATIRRTFERVFESGFVGDRLTVAWHAGEPLVLPLDYYRTAFDLIEGLRPPGTTVVHSIQTNATTLDDVWATFLRDRGVQVGVSLDGPQRLHDARRRSRTGTGSFERTMRGVRALQAAGTPFHVICVLTEASLDDPDELFDFFVDHDVHHVGFNIDEQEGVHGRSSLNRPDIDVRFRTFLSDFLFRVRLAPPGTLTVREFEGATAAIRGDGHTGGTPLLSPQNPQVTSFRLVSIDVDGRVSTFSPELLGLQHPRYGDFSLGDVHRQTFVEMAQGAALSALSEDISAGVENCRATCPYFCLCGGGAPANKLYETGSFRTTETLYCRLTTKAVVDVMLVHLEEAERLAPPAASRSGQLPPQSHSMA